MEKEHRAQEFAEANETEPAFLRPIMHIRTRIAITALAAPVFLAACALEAHAQDAYSAASPQTEAIVAPDCPKHDPSTSALPPQEELARDIRTIMTGEQSPVQQEALAQAARIAPGQMSDGLREVLVDAAAFVVYLPEQDSTGNARQNILSRLLACTLQPQFSQEELAADLISIASDDEYLEPVRWARQTTVAWLTMLLPAREMGEELKRAVIKAMPRIGHELDTTAREFLSKALLNQYASHSDADLAADIRMIQTGEEDIYTPLAAIHVASRRKLPGSDNSGGQVTETLGHESITAMIEILAWLNKKVNERAWLLERLEAAGDKEGKKVLEISHQDHSLVLHPMLAYAVYRLGTPEAIEALANAGNLHFSFTGTGNRSVAPIVDVLSGERLYTRQAQARLASLTNIVRYTPLIEPLSSENRDLIVRTAHRFLDREGLKDFQGLDMRGVFSSAVDLALALDEPDLTQIVETLALNREELIARGVRPEEVEYFQMDIKRALQLQLQLQQDIKEFRDPFSEPELPQDELVAAIWAIMEGEEGKAQFRALRQVARMEPEQIGDSLRAVLKKAFLYKYEAAMQRKEAGADFDFYNSYIESYHEDEGIMYPLEDAVRQLRDPSLVKFFVRIGRYGVCGNEPGSFSDLDGIFSQFPDTSAVLLAEAVSTPTTPLGKIYDGLALLSELAVYHKQGYLRFSPESRALLIATGRRFLEGGFLSSLPMQDTTGGYWGSRSWVLREAIVLAVALDDPDLIEIVEALATDPDKVTALGIPDEEAENTQENARRLLSWRPYTGISDC